jgi:divinyl protochlorophyllide a 8-vinyl-reductase
MTAEALGATAPESEARIGPNAITRMAEAASTIIGHERSHALFIRAGLAHHWRAPPEHMVRDSDVAILHRTLFEVHGSETAAAISAEAGRLTADYLLGNRIPRGAQVLLKAFPRRPALRLLIKAIARHAWTFSGRGTFTWTETPKGFRLRICDGPVSRLIRADAPVCHYYAATFERLLRRIGGDRIRVTETDCQAAGAPACSFLVTLD